MNETIGLRLLSGFHVIHPEWRADAERVATARRALAVAVFHLRASQASEGDFVVSGEFAVVRVAKIDMEMKVYFHQVVGGLWTATLYTPGKAPIASGTLSRDFNEDTDLLTFEG